MDNCVASYARQAVAGQCYLFHIERAGETGSVEVGVDGRIRQAFGPYNRRNTAATWAKQILSH
jgi:hypothetical protein